ncbi:phage head closure protein [Halomonas sp. ISL-60]|uniref:phage head closure protein n=1 Tax=Halomonas sp. ISL-56 TaxID=2819149 RepID=UPI001BEBD04A|nr:phage head closure protein [Halomonas sp. ISL-56]MBT2771316.1 phage head closure protein [Halomonas sp. ISL-60]MBT2800673.1 phage head closure protein [Halomonas sp. ISL-56]
MSNNNNAAKYMHVITIQKKTTVKDPRTGEVTTSWIDHLKDIRANVHFLSATERMAASALQTQITARIEIRYRTDSIDSSMRIVHKNKYYDIHGVIPDNDNGLKWLTMPVSEGVIGE